MSIELRGHHLLCMLTYKGLGYSDAFCRNYDAIIARLNQGEAIALIRGPDQICQPLVRDEDGDCAHCHHRRIHRRDALAMQAVSEALGIEVTVGQTLRLTPSSLTTLRQAFTQGQLRSGCFDCEWHSLCTDIAARGYADTRLHHSNE
ncbi:hypothetical protein BGP77_14765 [Saccharospirillum sp. MSK14-1]|uniref:DUF1284 domain-containing protein n=1 Tax=Saccharospirillum sp. MSK14-1 TaxID=1897632 RepID=UPI000D36CF78|nr:DUF1284 domain-containing protein [Saccharospirillum sp. MSK14-1]PTY37742.1 hypothetical protein BGP77_14765 [Saccharospirillum sp. MSK14-1]